MSADDVANITVTRKWNFMANTDEWSDTHTKVSQCGYSEYGRSWNDARPIK